MHPLRRHLFLLAAAAPLAAAPVLEIRATAAPPKIDGVLDDPAWRDAAHSDAFRQVVPLEDAAPSERTEFWVTYDADYIYVAVRCSDREPEKIRAVSMQRDQDNGTDDLVRVVLDTFHRQSDGYFFSLTAAGGKQDGLIQNKSEFKFEWDGLWLGKVSRDASGWSAEFALPLKSLSFDPRNDTWGFNVERVIRRTQETVRWTGLSRTKTVASLPDAGEIRGLSGLRQGHGIDFKPFATVARHCALVDRNDFGRCGGGIRHEMVLASVKESPDGAVP